MPQEIDPNTFTQKDLMQHLLQASQHAVTREEMTAQFRQAEQQNKERSEQVEKRFEQVEKRFEHVDKRFEQVDKRFEQIEKRFTHVDAQLEKQTQAIIGIHQEMKNQMRWGFGMLIALGGMLVGILKIIVV